MSEVNAANIASERNRLEQQIASLRQQIQQANSDYQRELNTLREQSQNSILRMNNQLEQQHREELARIAARYNELRSELTRMLERQQAEINARLERENREIYERIRQVETRISQRLEIERITADEYTTRMRRDWSNLTAREELLPFVEPHTPTMNQAQTAASEAYRLEQYQAVTAIMANTSLLIEGWRQSAEADWEEWQGLFQLCSTVCDYLRDVVKTSHARQVDCDGDVRTADLTRYSEADFARLAQLSTAADERLASCKRLNIEQTRIFLHELQRDQQFADDLLERSINLHCAHVRRLRVLRTVTQGLRTRGFEVSRKLYIRNDLLQGIRALYRNRYQHDWLVVTIVPDGPQQAFASLVNVLLYPAAAMDEGLQSAACSGFASYVSSLISQEGVSPVSVHAGAAFRNENGLYRARVNVRHMT